MTKAAIQHEHKEFIDTILYKVKAHSRLVSLSTEVHPNVPWHSGLIKEQEELMADIENSLYLKLDEVGESE
tara:strand:+ start:300 stop:512 length:213 start_codon:yes stop_codon:yes gene_type:complete